MFTTPLEVVKVTPQNLQEVAEWCGGKVAETESRRIPGRMDKYVWVPTPKGTAISWAFPGMFITRRLVVTVQGEIKETWAVFRRDYFEKNYFETPEAAINATWAQPKSAVKGTIDEVDLDKAIRKGKPQETATTIVVNVTAEGPLDGTQLVEDISKKLALQGSKDLGRDAAL